MHLGGGRSSACSGTATPLCTASLSWSGHHIWDIWEDWTVVVHKWSGVRGSVPAVWCGPSMLALQMADRSWASMLMTCLYRSSSNEFIGRSLTAIDVR